jgi:hypothetical protein
MNYPKNLAELKRWLAQPNATVTMIQHDWDKPMIVQSNLGPVMLSKIKKLLNVPRTVATLQTNGVQFQGGSWLYFKSTKEMRFDPENGTFDVCLNGTGNFNEIMRYQLGVPVNAETLSAT